MFLVYSPIFITLDIIVCVVLTYWIIYQQLNPYGGGESARPISGGLSGRPVDDPRIMGIGGSDPAVSAKSRALGVGGGRPELSLPPDASSTLFVEGLPANCSRREVARILYDFYIFQ